MEDISWKMLFRGGYLEDVIYFGDYLGEAPMEDGGTSWKMLAIGDFMREAKDLEGAI